ncbi:hypothetical protein LDENG_00213750 [Lucifuga dentata]|nr:hypothetical protein LDENG_00213750 [Lucifuga dentata]
MENGKTENEAEDKVEGVTEDKTELEQNVEEANLGVAQLQGLVAELHEGLHGAMTELSELRQRDHGLDEKLQEHRTDVDDKIMSLKNSLNTFKEELSTVMDHIKDMSSRQKEVQRRVDLLQSENSKHIISAAQSRKSLKGDLLAASGEEHFGLNCQSELSAIQYYFSSPTHSRSPLRSTTLTQNKRQRAALELLESERVYVSHLSLLLKANISFNGSEVLASKDKRPFPSSLRFLIQQHLELLHTLQERVLKCQWQGIMGDVFMKLTSKECNFLDFYVSYLKELPDCLSVVAMLATSSTNSAFLEIDIMGDETKPSLHTLLLQPVQRIPEYLLLLQGLLRQTDAEHPDHYLLLVCIQQFRSFIAQYHHLLQHNQELLLHNRKEVKRSTMKQLLKTVDCGIQTNNLSSLYSSSSIMLEHANHMKHSKQHLLEQVQSRHFQDWDRDQDHESHCYDSDRPSQLPYFSSDLDSRNHKSTVLGSIPESDVSDRSVSCQHHLTSRPADFRQVSPGSALADALGEFLLSPDPPGMEALYEEDGGSLHDVALFDRCLSASSDSSIDIAFVKCPKAPSMSQRAGEAKVSSMCEVYGGGGSQGNGYNKRFNQGSVSPDEAGMMQQQRPLQASQRKSKSLNGLQLDSAVSCLDGGPLSDHLQRAGGLGGHAKLERQGSKGSRGCSTLSRKAHNSHGNRAETDKQSNDLRVLLNMDSGIQTWEEPRWKGGADENNHTPFSERSRKQDKGGFRSSFKKLFKKK